ncbi:hypothetical protein BH20ACT3_BH20ACT3_07680 [soil metagenome]
MPVLVTVGCGPMVRRGVWWMVAAGGDGGTVRVLLGDGDSGGVDDDGDLCFAVGIGHGEDDGAGGGGVEDDGVDAAVGPKRTERSAGGSAIRALWC